MSDYLNIWLGGMMVAVVDRRRLRLQYTEEAATTYGLGVPLLSLNLPLVPDYYPRSITRAFLEGLLPEGEPRRAIAEELDIKVSDTYALMEALGRDCAGALVILPGNESLPAPEPRDAAATLSSDEFNERVINLRSAPLGVGRDVRLSLAGVQDKLVLTRRSDGRWALPTAATPSTHIIKPSRADLEASVQNELFCMKFAARLGLPVADVESAHGGGRDLIVVERFDRTVEGDGTISRVHQEDLCQATGLLPSKKYEESGGPSFRALARILDDNDRDALVVLARAMTVNIVIGNCDAHAKNFSLLHLAPNVIRLAPLYDLMSTQVYGEQRLAMYIDGVQRIENLTGARLVNEAVRWGLPRAEAADAVTGVLRDAPRAISATAAEVTTLPVTFVTAMNIRAQKLRESLDT